MSSLIRPFKKDRPLLATIRVARDSVRDSEPHTRIFSKVARNSAGDLVTLRFLHGLPVAVTLHDARRRAFLIFDAGAAEPTASPGAVSPSPLPDAFPSEPPAEHPHTLSGIPYFRRRWTADSTVHEVWYSYDYDAYLRTLLVRSGYGSTDWFLDDIQLSEPPASLFDHSAILGSQSERLGNIIAAAQQIFSHHPASPPAS